MENLTTSIHRPFAEAKRNVRGRRSLPIAKQRTHNRNVKFNSAELDFVESMACKNQLSLSEYIRTSAIGGEVDSREKQSKRDAITALGTASNALNTLCDKAHGRGGAIGKSECAELVSALNLLAEMISDLRNKV